MPTNWIAKKPKRNNAEHIHQRSFFAHINMLLSAKKLTLKERRLTFAVPNGGKRDAMTGFVMKQEGVEPGVPDILCLLARKGYHGLCIELKRPIVKGLIKPSLSIEQKEKIAMLNEEGYLAVVCYGYQEALRIYLDYLGVSDVN